MNIDEFIRDQLFSFPLVSNRYFLSFLSEYNSQYLERLKLIDDDNRDFVTESFSGINNTCEQIQSIATAFFEGRLHSAYTEFTCLIKRLEPLLIPNKYYRDIYIDNSLFKARRELQKEFEIKDMFHVPFERRYITKTNRFSVAGLPCLYLANSIYTCWEELNQPAFSRLAVSRFECQKTMNYLDLSFNLWYLKYGGDTFAAGTELAERAKQDRLDTLKRFLMLYPLYVACYKRVNGDSTDAHFKPEYIFPQLVMQWAVESGIDGVIYLSTKCSGLDCEFPFNQEPFLNFAFPVRTTAERGFCSTISNWFKLTEPTIWEVEAGAISVNSTNSFREENAKFSIPPISAFNPTGNEIISYGTSQFRQLEKLLSLKPLYTI